MIRLTLTLTEAQWLQQRLAKFDSSTDPVAQISLDKLGDAIDYATQQRVCPVCQEIFTQLNSIRCNNAKRQFGPYRRF